MTKKVLQFLVLVLVSSNAISQWSNDPTFNNAVCLARGGHTEPRIVSDAEGGAIIVWLEAYQNVYARIYAQRMSASGIALWTLDGVVVHSGGKLFRIEVVSDGLGGAIIVWHENRSQLDYDDDIYAQRINALGVRQWEPTGVLLCNSQGEQNFPVVCSDGGGGAIVVWRDFEDRINYAVFAQRVTSAGNVLWNPRGVPICTAATSALTSQAFPKVVSDGTGGANIMWDDRRGTSNDIYVQRINGLGTTLWTPNGVHVTSSPTDEYGVISPDGNKGVFIAWTDNELVYVQRVDSSGVVQYPGNGIAPCNNPSARSAPLIVSDGGSGAIVCWNSWQRTPPVFVQRISATGNLEWSMEGVPAGPFANYLTEDRNGGAIVAWSEYRNSAQFTDLYAQRVNSQGVGRWLTGGSPVTLAASSQSQVKAVFDGEGGAIFTWTDGRGGGVSGIYAQRIFSDGSLPVQLASYSGIRLAPGSVLISWTTTSEVNNYGFITERRLRGAELWSEVPNSFVAGHGTTNLPHDYSYTDNTAPVSTSQYRLKQVDLDGTVHCSEPIEIGGLMSVPVSAPKQFLLSQNYPNPFNPTTTIRFRLPASLGGAKQEVHASLKVFDLLGRNVITLIDGMQKPGDYSVTLNANKLASGVYMYRLQAGELVETKKLTVLR